MHTTLLSTPHHIVRRQHRFVTAELLVPHHVLSTCQVNGGRRDGLTHLCNHQSCEGGKDDERSQLLHRLSAAEYHVHACVEAGLQPTTTALMGTAANMEYIGMSSLTHDDAIVTAIATAGAETNGGRAGDPAPWHEGRPGWKPVHAGGGTINILLLFGCPLNEAALARAVVTLTEAKSAVLEELAVGSRASQGIATGTGTDQYAIAAPILNETPFTWTGKHSKLGELVGRTVHDAVAEALRWQNGLEPSRTRSIDHVLRRFGISRQDLLTPLLSVPGAHPAHAEALLHEPHVSACAFAIAALLDRQRYGTLPAVGLDDAVQRQCALLACGLSGQDHRFAEYLSALQARSFPDNLVHAMRIGWEGKWSA